MRRRGPYTRAMTWRAQLRLLLIAVLGCACTSSAPPARDGHNGDELRGPEVRFAGARRLSHAEYWNTLRDLFPMLQITPTSLASDETVRGFTNNRKALVASPLLVEQQSKVAEQLVRDLKPHWSKVAPCSEPGPKCARRFVEEVGKRVFRRPLLPSETVPLLDLFDLPAAQRDFTLGQQLSLLAMLQSPAFLYRFEATHPMTGYEIASHISYFVWASPPDEKLMDAAERGELSTPDGLRASTQRLLEDPRARTGISLLFDEWLKLSRVLRIPKPEVPSWNGDVAEDSVESARRFSWHLFETGGTSADLLTSHRYPVSRRLARTLQAEVGTDGWEWVDVGSQRPGVLGHPAFLAAYAHSDYPSPVLRGVYVLDRLLCEPPEPPPNAFPLPAPNTTEKPRTNRQAYVRATRGPGCSHCHNSINQLGFAFEHFDAFAGYRETDNGLDVESFGNTMGFKFDNASELATQLSKDERYHRCVAESWLRYALGGPPDEFAPEALEPVYASFASSGFRLKALVEAIVVHTSGSTRNAK